MKNSIKRAISFLTVVALLFGALNTSAFATDDIVLKCEKADEWTALFDRRNVMGKSWLGADGIYSVALNGDDSFGSANCFSNTFFIFSDTLMGSSNSNGEVVSNWSMPSHSSALLRGNKPLFIQFVHGEKADMSAEPLFGERKWMLDCLVKDDSLYVLGFSPTEDWKPENIDMYKIPLKYGNPDFKSFSKTSNISQLFHRTQDGKYIYAFGTGITANTEFACAPNPDGYIYFYGYIDCLQEFSRKDMIVARIDENDFPDFSKIKYWNGTGWSNEITDCKPILKAVSCEVSVSPVEVGLYKGKYIAIYTENTQSSKIMYAIGESPVGPFSESICFYNTPEHGTASADGNGTLYTYNAKAHPHLSKGDKLLVSYNCNNMGGEQYTTDYHPRFIWLDLDPYSEPDELNWIEELLTELVKFFSAIFKIK